MKCLISCEHASNRVPSRFVHVFKGRENILTSHQAYDPGAAGLARRLAAELHAPAHLGSISRLLIDLNRSPTNRRTLFSPYSKNLQPGERQLLLRKYYVPYREKVEDAIDEMIGKGEPVLHISIHSFTPVKSGKVRNADIGLLYDSARRNERDFCAFIAELLLRKIPDLRVRRNYPYLGKTDGFTSFLRKKHAARYYAGVEIEMNQNLLSTGSRMKKKVEDVLGKGIGMVLRLNDFSKGTKIVSKQEPRDAH